MGINKVLSGAYSNCPIEGDGRRKYVRIKTREGYVPISKDTVEAYELKDDQLRTDYHVYTIKWLDGQKSVIRIYKAYSPYLVSGCESGPLSKDEVADETIRTLTTILGWIVGIVLVGIIICLIFNVRL